MHCLLIPLLVPLMLSYGSVAEAIHQTFTEYQYILTSIEEDLKLLNFSCKSDSCAEEERENSLNSHACHCGPYCVQLDTCCLDSPYNKFPKPKVRPTCRSAYNGETLYMIDRCPSGESAWEELCKEEWNGEDDIFKIVPVTSLQTSITYKNYFCFKCHENETGDDFVHWSIRLESNSISEDYDASNKRISLKYDNSKKTWMAVMGDYNAVSFPVKISITIPQNMPLDPLVRDCKVDVISSCSENWTDKEVPDKCKAYTAIKQTYRDGRTFMYRNMHCAICNFEMINNVTCLTEEIAISGFSTTKFSFTHLLDINRQDGDIVGRIQKCNEDYVWDPYANKCRKLTCALPGYIVRNDKCVPQ